MKKLAFMLAVFAIAGVASANLLGDPGFDGSIGSFSGYTNPASLTSDHDWATGSGMTWAAAGGQAVHQDATDSTLWQGVALPAEGAYSFNFEYMGTGMIARVLFSGGVNWFQPVDNDGLGDLDLIADVALPDAASMTAGSVPFSVTAGDVSNYSYLFVNITQAANSDGVVDNADVVPEPASLSLLGLGAVALIRRRR